MSNPSPSPTNHASTAKSNLTSWQVKLKLGCALWALFRLFIMPVVMAKATLASSYGAFLLWQGLMLLPVLLFVPTIKQANHPFRLMMLSFLVMMYMGVATSQWLIAWYENKGGFLVGAYALESGLLLFVLVCLFMVLKKLPPMYKGR